MFDKDLNFQKRIKLRTTQVSSDTLAFSIKLYEDKMYVMLSSYFSAPPFYLQIFDLEGELVKCLIKENEIGSSEFFSIDRLGNLHRELIGKGNKSRYSPKKEQSYTLSRLSAMLCRKSGV